MKLAFVTFSAALLISIAYAATPQKLVEVQPCVPVDQSKLSFVAKSEVWYALVVYRPINIFAARYHLRAKTIVQKDKFQVKVAAKTATIKLVKKPVKIKGCKRGRTRKHGVCGRWK